MGTHENIDAKRWPRQGGLLGKAVEVCFKYDSSETFRGRCVRDDAEEPYRTIFSLENGRVVLDSECHYSTVNGELI